MEKLASLGLWFAIFSFVAGTLNPLEWGMFTRALAVLFTYIILTKEESK
jgi:hypothetical protein